MSLALYHRLSRRPSWHPNCNHRKVTLIRNSLLVWHIHVSIFSMPLAGFHADWSYYYVCMCVFATSTFFFSSGRACFLVFSASGHAGSPPEHHNSSVGPGRGSWRVLSGWLPALPACPFSTLPGFHIIQIPKENLVYMYCVRPDLFVVDVT